MNALRLDCARDLLAATELSMLEVSMESGFDSLRTFNRVFRNGSGRRRASIAKAAPAPCGAHRTAAAQRRVTPCALGKKPWLWKFFLTGCFSALAPEQNCVTVNRQNAAGCPAALRRLGRIGKQVQDLCGTAAVREQFRLQNVTVGTHGRQPGR